MIDTSVAYKAAIVADARRMFAKAIIDLISPDIIFGTVAASDESIYSKSAQLYDKNFDSPVKYATLEPGRWLLGGGYKIYPANPAELTDTVKFMTQSLCGADGTFSTAAWVELPMSNLSILQACSVYFSENEGDGLPTDFVIEVKQGGIAYATKTVTGNTATSCSFEGFTVYNPDAIRVTVTKWSVPYRRFRAVQIVPGIYETWTNDILCSLDIAQEVNFSCLSLPYGTCTLSMENLSRRFEPRGKGGLFKSIEERQAIPIYLGVKLPDGSTEWVKRGVFHQMSGGWKTGSNGTTMQWNLVDIIGLIADRDFKVPDVLPTTLSGWLAEIVGQLGANFASRYHVDPAYANLTVTCAKADVQGKTCGEVLRYACMATGTFPRADDESGDLTAEPLWNAGNYFTLDNMPAYPTMSANDDLAAVIFKLNDESGTIYTVSGNNSASSKTISVNNPFISTAAQAITAAKNILLCYGGNKIDISSRGDLSSELGDVDSVQLDKSSATSARRMKQAFNFSGGVMKNLPSTLLQADGSFLYQTREIIKESGTWTAPSGVSSLRIIVSGGGEDGADGTAGTWPTWNESAKNGEDGEDGLGGKVFAATIDINNGQSFVVTIGGAGQETSFGSYSSANGQRFDGFTDIANGDVYARDGVALPIANSGDGGKGGTGGAAAVTHEEYLKTVDENGNIVNSKTKTTVIDAYPQEGTSGAAGASGCVVVYYDKAVSA